MHEWPEKKINLRAINLWTFWFINTIRDFIGEIKDIKKKMIKIDWHERKPKERNLINFGNPLCLFPEEANKEKTNQKGINLLNLFYKSLKYLISSIL